MGRGGACPARSCPARRSRRSMATVGPTSMGRGGACPARSRPVGIVARAGQAPPLPGASGMDRAFGGIVALRPFFGGLFLDPLGRSLVMTDFPKRRRIRLPPDTYRRPGAYFVTVCLHHRRRHFGACLAGIVRLSPVGDICRRELPAIPDRWPAISLDSWVIMPDHLHCILLL